MAVLEAQAARVLVEDTAQQTYGFRHDLVRELVYDDLRAATRADLHARLALALEARLPPDPYPTRLGEVAFHWLQTDGNVDAALRASIRAARASTRAGAHPEAARHYDHVLALWHRTQQPDDVAGTDLVTVLTEAAKADHWAGFTASALLRIEHALTVAPADDADAIAALQDRRTHYAWLDQGQLTRGDDLLGTIEAEATRERMRASELMQRGHYAECVEVARRALVLAVSADSASDEIRATIILGVGLGLSGHGTDGVATITGALRRAEVAGSAEEVMAAHINLTFVLLALGRTEEAAQAALSGTDKAVRRGLAKADGAILAGNAAEALTRLGRLAEADRVLQKALDRKPSPALVTILALARAEVDVLRGRFDEAEATLRAIADHGVHDDYQFQSQIRAVEAGLQLWDPAGGRVVLLGDLRGGVGSDIAALPVEEDVLVVARLLWLGLRSDADSAALARMTGDDAWLRSLVEDGAAIRHRAGSLATEGCRRGSRLPDRRVPRPHSSRGVPAARRRGSRAVAAVRRRLGQGAVPPGLLAVATGLGAALTTPTK